MTNVNTNALLDELAGTEEQVPQVITPDMEAEAASRQTYDHDDHIDHHEDEVALPAVAGSGETSLFAMMQKQQTAAELYLKVKDTCLIVGEDKQDELVVEFNLKEAKDGGSLRAFVGLNSGPVDNLHYARSYDNCRTVGQHNKPEYQGWAWGRYLREMERLFGTARTFEGVEFAVKVISSTPLKGNKPAREGVIIGYAGTPTTSKAIYKFLNDMVAGGKMGQTVKVKMSGIEAKNAKGIAYGMLKLELAD